MIDQWRTFLAACDYPDITIRQLLTHATDLDPFIPNRDQLGSKELREAMFHLNRRSQPAFLYSDVHFLLLGFLLEKIFEQDLDQIIEEQVFGTMGHEGNNVWSSGVCCTNS